MNGQAYSAVPERKPAGSQQTSPSRRFNSLGNPKFQVDLFRLESRDPPNSHSLLASARVQHFFKLAEHLWQYPFLQACYPLVKHVQVIEADYTSDHVKALCRFKACPWKVIVCILIKSALLRIEDGKPVRITWSLDPPRVPEYHGPASTLHEFRVNDLGQQGAETCRRECILHRIQVHH